MKKEHKLRSFFLSIIFLAMALAGPAFAQSSLGLTLNSPDDGVFSNKSSIDHAFNVSGVNGTYNCTLYYNDAPYGTNENAMNGTITTITTNSTPPEGSDMWKVECSADGATASGQRTINIDRTSPSIILTSPTQGESFSSLAIPITVEITEINPDFTDVSILDQSGNVINSTNISVSGTSSTTLDVPSEGTYKVRVNSYDKAGNSNSVMVSDIVVATPKPGISITSPKSDSFLNMHDVTVMFSLTVIDSANISIIDPSGQGVDSKNVTGSTATLSVIADGVYNITATASDSLGNPIVAQESNIIIDTTSPQLNITSPLSDTSLSTSKISISFSLAEQNPDYTSISLYDTNGTIVNSTNTAGTSTMLQVYSLGTYRINAVAYDKAGNVNSAEVLNVTVDKLYVEPPPGGSGGGSSRKKASSGGSGGAPPSFWAATNSVSSADFTNGFTVILGAKQRIRFNVGNDTHYLGILNLTNTSAVINVSSEPQQFTLNQGDEIKADVNNDSYYDIYFKLNSISQTIANLTVKGINETTRPIVRNIYKIDVIEPPAPAVVSECSFGEKRCNAHYVEDCINGSWVVSQLCANGCDMEKTDCIKIREDPVNYSSYFPLLAIFMAMGLGAILFIKLVTPKVKEGIIFSGELGYRKALEERIEEAEGRLSSLERAGKNVMNSKMILEDIKRDVSSGLRYIAEGRLEALLQNIESLELI